MIETAFSAALSRRGVLAEDVEFDVAITKYLNSGGTIARATDRLNAAATKMSGVGQGVDATSAIKNLPVARQQVGDERGHFSPAQTGRPIGAPPSSSNHGREGHYRDAAPSGHPITATPVREPTVGQRTAALTVAKVVAITIMDTIKIDGRAVGDWTVADARRAGHDKSREGYILTEAARVVANAPGNARLRDVVKVNEMQRIQQRAMEVADAV